MNKLQRVLLTTVAVVSLASGGLSVARATAYPLGTPWGERPTDLRAWGPLPPLHHQWGRATSDDRFALRLANKMVRTVDVSLRRHTATRWSVGAAVKTMDVAVWVAQTPCVKRTLRAQQANVRALFTRRSYVTFERTMVGCIARLGGRV